MAEAERWTEVDNYITSKLIGSDPALEEALRSQREGGLPGINVTAPQGKMLNLIALMTGTRRILEIGTLGGYSTIWLARALPDGGRLISLELEKKHADIARNNLKSAGLENKVEIRVGKAMDSLAKIADNGEGPFDLIFIDADKVNIPGYFDLSLSVSRKGTVIVVDNAVRGGKVADKNTGDPSVEGVRNLMEKLSENTRVEATAIQTVGAKGYDGFVLLRVGDE